MTKILPFRSAPRDRSLVGRVHTDGSITFRGERYPTLREVPSDCLGLRPDIQTHCEWRALYSAIDPKRKRRPSRL